MSAADPSVTLATAPAEDPPKGDLFILPETATAEDRPIAPDQFDPDYETTRPEIWSYYSYYIGNNGLTLFNFAPTAFQNLLYQAAVVTAIASAAAEAAAHHVAEQEPEPAASAAAEHEQKEDEEEEDAEPVGAVAAGLVVVDGRGLLGRGEGDVGVGCDDVGDLLDAGLDGGAVLPLLKLRVHAAADVADLGVGEDAFEAVADLDAVLVVLDGEDKDDALVGGLGADLPGVFERGGPGVDVLAVQGFDGDDFDGGVGLGIDLPSEVFDVFLGGRVDDVGEVADVAGGLGQLVGRFGVGEADERAPEESGPEEDAFCSHNAMVRSEGAGGSTKAEGLPMADALCLLAAGDLLGKLGTGAVGHVRMGG